MIYDKGDIAKVTAKIAVDGSPVDPTGLTLTVRPPVGNAVTATAATDLFTVTAHGYTNGDLVAFDDLAGGAPLVNGTTYYVRDATANTFKVTTTSGGAAVDLTSDVTAGNVRRLAVYTYPTSAEIVKEAIGEYVGSITLSQEGIWVYRWESTGTGAGAEEGTLEVRRSALTYDPSDPPTWVPSVGDVAVLLRARTNVMGTEVGTFDASTRPTATQVQSVIDEAIGDVIARVGPYIPTRYTGEAKRLAAMRAAALVESSFFPNQIETERSAHRQYTAMYLSGSEALAKAIPRALRLA